MNKLDECKNKIAVQQGFKDWDDYVSFMIATKVGVKKVILATDLVAEEYRMQGRFFTEDEIEVIKDAAWQEGNNTGFSDGVNSLRG